MHRASVKLLSRIIVFLWADQVAKLFIRELMTPFQSIRVLPFFHIEYVRNQGIAFGIFEGHTAVIIVISSLIVGLLALAAVVVRHDGRWTWPFVLLGAGSLGNLIDRLWFGSVTDFIRLPHWPAFNFADAFIVIGVVLLVRAMLWRREPESIEGYWYENGNGWEGEGEPDWQNDDAWDQTDEQPGGPFNSEGVDLVAGGGRLLETDELFKV
ncbi:MAG: signal peptidase II [Actinobacteria bacterium]|nr:signal peptidase II [Actinomycetota bacterium]